MERRLKISMSPTRQIRAWGKGYAWNPVNFLDRAKDPADPDQTLEGNVMATLDYIRSFAGPLKTLSFTPVLFPVYDHLNDSFGLNNYFSPSLTTMVNLNDPSYSITPELLYTGITNLELRLRFGWQGGGRETEFEEKANRYRLELQAGYYF